MALPPYTWRLEQFGGIFADAPAGERFLTKLNGFAKDVSGGLSAVRVDFTKTVDLTTGVPLKFKNALPGKPTGVLVAAAQDITAGVPGTPVALGGVAWKTDADQIAVSDVLGLTAAHKYRVTFLVLA